MLARLHKVLSGGQKPCYVFTKLKHLWKETVRRYKLSAHCDLEGSPSICGMVQSMILENQSLAQSVDMHTKRSTFEEGFQT